MSHSTKPKLDINSQISYLETKGINFQLIINYCNKFSNK